MSFILLLFFSTVHFFNFLYEVRVSEFQIMFNQCLPMYVKCKQNLCKISAKSLQNVCKMSTECLSCVCPLFSHYFISQRLSCVPNVWSQISDYFQYFSIHTSQKKIAILKRWKFFTFTFTSSIWTEFCTNMWSTAFKIVKVAKRVIGFRVTISIAH